MEINNKTSKESADYISILCQKWKSFEAINPLLSMFLTRYSPVILILLFIYEIKNESFEPFHSLFFLSLFSFAFSSIPFMFSKQNPIFIHEDVKCKVLIVLIVICATINLVINDSADLFMIICVLMSPISSVIVKFTESRRFLTFNRKQILSFCLSIIGSILIINFEDLFLGNFLSTLKYGIILIISLTSILILILEIFEEKPKSEYFISNGNIYFNLEGNSNDDPFTKYFIVVYQLNFAFVILTPLLSIVASSKKIDYPLFELFTGFMRLILEAFLIICFSLLTLRNITKKEKTLISLNILPIFLYLLEFDVNIIGVGLLGVSYIILESI